MKRFIAALALVPILFSAPALAQTPPEEQVFNAFAVAAVQGTMMQAGEHKAMLVGTLAGLLFVETEEGPVEAGKVSCAASMRLDRQSREQAGSGACTFTAADGAVAWGSFDCTGYELVGCHGPLTLNGGTGRLQGATGGGAMTWRPSAHGLEAKADGSVQIGSTGLLIWREFKLVQSSKQERR